ncbi:hypothetical protein LX70_00584 [Defluviimonas denitrificans]|jgi:hypothetical protein|uniref:Uncharacterized protein n=1 Tax=Albidovulum denitrificans TaxID=404881 RepID=A0A2S8SD40_9RHOB|nr:hypothetical protein [Defluviimonas denitrificans]PQV58771.1 hypothetical protein LX70_00584 [Defluviimonas denitrificans]
MRDLFGNEITEEEARRRLKRRDPEPNGYAWKPGTGPEGEKCKGCEYFVRRHMSKTYFKCRLARENWTKTRRTDIKANAPACKFWKAISDDER